MAKKRAWVISVDMGYGHQRAAYPLKDFAYPRIITANNDDFIPENEKKVWGQARVLYESISRFKDIPLVGNTIFHFYDGFQKISPFFPFRDLSTPTSVVMYIKKLILKKGVCKSIVEAARKTNLPFVTTFFIPALAADYLKLKNKIYCIVTDSDINRAWVPENPAKTKIIYLAPCRHTVMRLREYGVPEKNIILTGFPLPYENVGNKNMDIVKKDLGDRLFNLDPSKTFLPQYKAHLEKILGSKNVKVKGKRKLTITYLVGGAGAQKEVGMKILKGLYDKIRKRKVSINLVAGVRKEVADYFKKQVHKLKLDAYLKKNITIIYAEDKFSYFEEMNKVLRDTDVIWTKPSELSFYTALGLPVITTPPVGAHEYYNQQWLEHMGAGFMQEDLKYVDDWFYYWLHSGRLAHGAMNGFVEAPKLGTHNIFDVIFHKRKINTVKSVFEY